jgi:hypothetical protein
MAMGLKNNQHKGKSVHLKTKINEGNTVLKDTMAPPLKGQL